MSNHNLPQLRSEKMQNTQELTRLLRSINNRSSRKQTANLTQVERLQKRIYEIDLILQEEKNRLSQHFSRKPMPNLEEPLPKPIPI